MSLANLKTRIAIAALIATLFMVGYSIHIGHFHTMDPIVTSMSECCDFTTSHGNTVDSVSGPLLFFLPVLFLLLAIAVGYQNSGLKFHSSYLPYFFHKFSEGIFQLE